MVFQHFNLYPHKTVLENVTLAPIKVLGISKAEAEKTAEKFLRYVNMWDKKDSYPGMLTSVFRLSLVTRDKKNSENCQACNG